MTKENVDINNNITNDKLDEFADADTGGRNVTGILSKIFFALLVLWSMLQMWVASPLNSKFSIFFNKNIIPIIENITGKSDLYVNLVINANQLRFFHLTFAIILVFFAFPISKKATKKTIPWYDWVLLILGFCAAILPLFVYDKVQVRGGKGLYDYEIIFAVIGILILLEATRRSLGPALSFIAAVFLIFNFIGDASFIHNKIAHNQTSLAIITKYQWFSDNGIFGVPLGVSSEIIFLFVLFGALLEKSGAGSYFIRLAFSLFGFLKGGPAIAAIFSSGMTGMISGSSIANTVTTGTFTIPMMKKVGFSSEKAGAVEVSSSVNGQIMPPIMGAAAFLIAININMDYEKVVKHAALPAIISYIALVYIVYLEACKMNTPILKTAYKVPSPIAFILKIIAFFIVATFFFVSLGFTLNTIINVMGSISIYVIISMMMIIYLLMLYYNAKHEKFDPDQDPHIEEPLPKAMPIFLSGLHYFIPVLTLIWLLMVKKLSPALSAYWSIFILIFILITQRPIVAFFSPQDKNIWQELKKGIVDLFVGLANGARGMIGIALAVSTAGIIVGVVTLTDVGPAFADIIEFIAGDNIILLLLLIALLSLILGMGLPTTANYIIVSLLMVPVMLELGAHNGLIIPLIAAHLFCFYFGLMADVTPPVGLASFAAAAISGGNPIKTGVIAFFYSLRTAILPFIFIFSPALLLIDVNWIEGLTIVVSATIGILIFTSATQGWLITRCNIFEIVGLLLVAATLLRPGLWIDKLYSPYTIYTAQDILTKTIDDSKVDVNKPIRLRYNDDDSTRDGYVLIDRNAEKTGEELLLNYGIETVIEDGKVITDFIEFNSPAQKNGIGDFYILKQIELPNKQPSRYWAWLPAILLLSLIILWQKRRLRKQA